MKASSGWRGSWTAPLHIREAFTIYDSPYPIAQRAWASHLRRSSGCQKARSGETAVAAARPNGSVTAVLSPVPFSPLGTATLGRRGSHSTPSGLDESGADRVPGQREPVAHAELQQDVGAM